MANRIYASPGVYTSEKDLTFTTESVGVTTLGAVGETLKGPAFQPIFVRNYDEFKVTFGGTSPEKFKNTQIIKYELPYIAKSYLSQSNQLFVTRVLGLSGYEAGKAFAIRTLGTCNQDTLVYTSENMIINFEINTNDKVFVLSGTGDTIDLVDYIANLTGIQKNKFESTFDLFFNKQNSTVNTNSILYWGIVDGDLKAELTDDSGLNNFIDAYELPQGIPASDRDLNLLNNEFVFNETSDLYGGAAFALYVEDFQSINSNTKAGSLKIFIFNQNCQPNAKYHKKLVTTLRSRGRYIANELSFDIESNTVSLDNFDSASINPFATFDIVGTTTNNTPFTYTVSLDKTKKNYIKNVLGSDAFDKDTHLFVEEVYDSTLRKGWNYGEIKGLYGELININNWDHYNFQYQSPATPFFVSELRGGVPQRLFRLISISDGSNANTEIKVSIANVDLDKKIFDVLIRSFNDSDKNPVIIERYLGVSMDESQDNYIGRRIGTIDNKYRLRSSYVIAEMAENAPKDGVASGFEGYEFRSFGIDSLEQTFVGVPELPYKNKYYAPGETIVDPPFANPIISVGDKIRKVYLGFTDAEFGFDADLLKFKGKDKGFGNGENPYNTGSDWATKTKGFHFDIDASSLITVNGDQVFVTGVGTFTDALEIARTTSHPYHDIRTRKFTALFAGGFDGWDIYRESRTNTDEYKIARNGFIAGDFSTFNSVEYGELFGTSDYYATLFAAKTFENPEQTTINILVTPGIDLINNTDLVRDVIEIVEEKRFDSIYLPTLPDIKLLGNNNSGNTEEWFYPDDIISELENTEIDSNYTAVYYPWIQISDTENNANLFIPPTAEVVKNLAFTDNVAHPWFATAGYNRGIVNCIRARIPLDQESRDILYPGRINPIATFSDVGTVIWGNRNLQTKNSALNRLNIRRLLLQARKLIVSVANRLLFDPNDDQVRSEFLSLVNPILDNIRRERGLTDFRVSLVNDVEDDDRNTLRGKIFIKPTPTLEFVELEFVVTPTSVSFDNI